MSIKVLLWFDVEDYITPESDDALMLLLEMLDSKGIKGTFKLVGEKTRVLKKRGRTDILEKLLGHEIGYHTDMHSMHPTISEYLEPMGFRDGAIAFEKNEIDGLEDVINITGMKPSTYGQPGASWAPQVLPVLRLWSIPSYLDSHDMINIDGKPFWYGGILTLLNLKGLMRMELAKDGLDKGKKEFDRLYGELIKRGDKFVSIYYHPCEFATTEFWDGCNFIRGQNTPRNEWRPAPLRPQGSIKYYVDMLGCMIDYIKTKDNVEFITASQAVTLEHSKRGPLSSVDVKNLASQIIDKINYCVYNDYSLSASELFSLFCRYLNRKKLEPELIYGPENQVNSNITGKVKVSDIKKAINISYPEVCGFKQLPDYFSIGGRRISPEDMTCTLAKIIKLGLEDNETTDIVRGKLIPVKHVNHDDRWGRKWVIFPEKFRVPNIKRMAKLQTWTLKPAIF